MLYGLNGLESSQKILMCFNSFFFFWGGGVLGPNLVGLNGAQWGRSRPRKKNMIEKTRLKPSPLPFLTEIKLVVESLILATIGQNRPKHSEWTGILPKVE